ncbi:MAG: metallophosphoesterase [Deltaproteobacteria bacterium RBG_13_52_11]|nr:MAG: metallophosphoesterase [Deltaproteobacteria bacterium RBG_13_52_11]
MSLFLLTFFFLYSSLHLYIFLKIKGAFALGTGLTIILILFMAVMVSAPVLVRVSERYALESFARLLSCIGYTWLGVVFLFCISSFLIDLYRLAFSAGGMVLRMNLSSLIPSPRLTFFIPVLLTSAVASYGFFEARSIRSERVVITSTKVPREVGQLTVVQISDVHLGLIVREGRLKKILREVKRAQPDILVSTGDLVDGQIDNLGELAGPLRDINPPYGKFAVTGNHEFYAGLDQALQFIEEAGFTVLRGEAREVAEFVTIVGVDDPTGRHFGLFRGPSEKAIFAGLPRERFTLLLKHPPVVDKEILGLFDLQLSGHTHKGQIFPFNYASKIFFPYDAGLVHLPRHSSLYVSRGSGTWGPPIRFLAPPEVTIITVVHADRE